MVAWEVVYLPYFADSRGWGEASSPERTMAHYSQHLPLANLAPRGRLARGFAGHHPTPRPQDYRPSFSPRSPAVAWTEVRHGVWPLTVPCGTGYRQLSRHRSAETEWWGTPWSGEQTLRLFGARGTRPEPRNQSHSPVPGCNACNAC